MLQDLSSGGSLAFSFPFSPLVSIVPFGARKRKGWDKTKCLGRSVIAFASFLYLELSCKEMIRYKTIEMWFEWEFVMSLGQVWCVPAWHGS